MSSPQASLTVEDVARGLAVLILHTKKDLTSKQEPPSLSHYRVLPEHLKTAYGLLQQGAQLVRATATKYALVGAINTDDQGNLGADLLKGCELIGAAAHVTTQDPSGCSGAVRSHTQKAALAIYVATLKLVEAFHPGVVRSNNNSNINTTIASIATKENNVGAQKTGAVWEACDQIINKLLPQGNRSAMRREIFTWTRECNDTMEEFEEMIELGPKIDDETDDAEDPDEDEDDYDCFGGGGDDQYSEEELPIARACLALLKNSRGNLKIALETCEALGKLANETTDSSSSNEIETKDKDNRHLAAILQVHQYAKRVGVGVTDLGSLMYPPLLPPSACTDLTAGVRKQAAFIIEFQTYILDLENMPEKVSELASTLKTAAETRENDFLEALNRIHA